MAWIESHQDIGQHPKTIALATALNGDLPTAVGVLHLLWHFALKFSWRTGNLQKYPPEAIAAACGWRGKTEELIKSLQKTGWLDDMRIHDWHDYAGRIVHDRLYNEKRRKTTTNAVKRRQYPATVPDPTLPNHIKKVRATTSFKKPGHVEVQVYAQSIGFALDAEGWCDHYEANGWRVGKSPMKDWKAAVRQWKRRKSEFGSRQEPMAVPALPKFKENIPAEEDIFDPTEKHGVA